MIRKEGIHSTMYHAKNCAVLFLEIGVLFDYPCDHRNRDHACVCERNTTPQTSGSLPAIEQLDRFHKADPCWSQDINPI